MADQNAHRRLWEYEGQRLKRPDTDMPGLCMWLCQGGVPKTVPLWVFVGWQSQYISPQKIFQFSSRSLRVRGRWSIGSWRPRLWHLDSPNRPGPKFWTENRFEHPFARWNGNAISNSTARFPSTWENATSKSTEDGKHIPRDCGHYWAFIWSNISIASVPVYMPISSDLYFLGFTAFSTKIERNTLFARQNSVSTFCVLARPGIENPAENWMLGLHISWSRMATH